MTTPRVAAAFLAGAAIVALVSCLDNACERDVTVKIVSSETGAPVQGASVELDSLCCEFGEREQCIFETNAVGNIEFELSHISHCWVTVTDAEGRTTKAEFDAPFCDDNVHVTIEVPGGSNAPTDGGVDVAQAADAAGGG